VDIKNASDKTLQLTNSSWKSGHSRNPVRSVTCCKDLSDLCNISDIVNEEGCAEEWAKSPAAKSGDFQLNGTDAFGTYCTLNVQYEQTLVGYNFHFKSVKNVVGCNGTLKANSC